MWADMASKEYNPDPADTDKQTGAISAIEIFQPLIILAVNAEELIASPKLKQIIGDGKWRWLIILFIVRDNLVEIRIPKKFSVCSSSYNRQKSSSES